VLLSPEPCGCGSPLPALRVEGRTNDTLTLTAADGRAISLQPLALVTVVEETPGVRRCQLIQTAPSTVVVRLEAEDRSAAWQRVAARLRTYLASQGLRDAHVELAADPPRPDPCSGKFRQV
jgi:phenylacetate-CoA ligase